MMMASCRLMAFNNILVVSDALQLAHNTAYTSVAASWRKPAQPTNKNVTNHQYSCIHPYCPEGRNKFVTAAGQPAYIHMHA